MKSALVIIRKLFFCVAFVSYMAVCFNVQGENNIKLESVIVIKAANAVTNYIIQSKGWSKEIFNVQFIKQEGANLVFRVNHKSDETSMFTGGLSVEVYIDAETNKIVQELGSQ